MAKFSKNNSSSKALPISAAELGVPFELASKFISKWQIKTLEFLLPYVRPNLSIELVAKISLKITNYIHYKALSLGTPLEKIFDFTLDSQIEALIFLVETAKINISIEIAVEIALAITTDLHKQALKSGVPVHYIKSFINKFQLQAFDYLVEHNDLGLTRVDQIVKISLNIATPVQLEALMLDIPAASAHKFLYQMQISVFLYLKQHQQAWKSNDEIVKIALEYINDIQYQALLYSGDITLSKDCTRPAQLEVLRLGVEIGKALKFKEEFQIEALQVLMRKFGLKLANAEVTNLALYIETEDQLDAYENGVPLYKSLQFKSHNVMTLEHLMKVASVSAPTQEMIQLALQVQSFEQARALQMGIPLKDTGLFTTLVQIYAYNYLTKNNKTGLKQSEIIDLAVQITNPVTLLAIKLGVDFSTAQHFITECQVDVYLKLKKYLNEEAKNIFKFWQWVFPNDVDPLTVALKFISEEQCKMLETCHDSADIIHYAEQHVAGEGGGANEVT